MNQYRVFLSGERLDIKISTQGVTVTGYEIENEIIAGALNNTITPQSLLVIGMKRLFDSLGYEELLNQCSQVFGQRPPKTLSTLPLWALVDICKKRNEYSHAGHFRSHPVILEFLARYGDLYEKREVARNRTSDEKILSYLFNLGEAAIWDSLLANPRLPQYMLEQILNSRPKDALVFTLSHANADANWTTEHIQNGNLDREKQNMMAKMTTNPHVLDVLAKSKDSGIIYHVIKNWSTSEETLVLLGKMYPNYRGEIEEVKRQQIYEREHFGPRPEKERELG